MNELSIETTLASRLAQVRKRVEDAAILAGRDPETITIVGVTKTVDRSAVDRAYDLGLRVFGENRVQDARSKFSTRLPADASLHMIGSLQTNKAKLAAELFDMIESVDRPSLVQALAKQAENMGKTIEVLLEINVAGETQKAGCPLNEAQALLDLVLEHPGLRARGLMTMAPLVDDPETVRPVFRGLQELARSLEESRGVELPVLSMGMSNDFQTAISEGATHVRIGRAIFGDR